MLTTRRAAVEDCVAAAGVLRRSITELCAEDHRFDPKVLKRWLTYKSAAQLREWVCDPAYAAFVAVRDDTIVGFGLIRDDGNVRLNYVDPQARFSGVSTALLLAMEAWARDRGLASCALQSTQTALGFYRARGYLPDGPDLLRKRF
jgi:GNAT superfamily N-acetyltransferase